MRLNSKIGLILVLPMLALLAILAALLHAEVVQRFVDLERQELIQHHERLIGAIDAEFADLQRIAVDWGHYDETYDFIAGDNPGWVEANLDAATFANLRLDGLAVLGANGAIVNATGYDEATNTLTELPEPLLQALGAFVRERGLQPQRGLLRLDDRILQVALSDVSDTEAEADPNGSLVMMRDLDQGEVDALAERIRLQLSFLPLQDGALDLLNTTLKPIGAPPWLRIEDNDYIASYSTLDDLRGEPTVLMQVRMPRQIFMQGRDAVLDLLLFAFAAQVLLLSVTFLGIRRVALRRLSGMVKRLHEIGDENNPRERLRIRGKDEIDQVAGSVNAMLDALQAAEARRREASERQRQLNAVLVEMATDESLTDGSLDTLLRVLRGSLLRGAHLHGWSLWMNSEDAGLVCLGQWAARLPSPVDPSELASLLARQEPRQSKLLPCPSIDPNVQIRLFPFEVESRLGALCVWTDQDHPVAEDEQNFLIAAAQLVERSVLANQLALRQQQLKQQAEIDKLTGLTNRSGFERELQLRLANASLGELSVALLFIDLDRFKPVNDTYGHAVGDWLLQQVGVRLRDRLRAGDLVARLGGDEFTVILSLLKHAEDAGRVADKLVEALNTPFHHEGVGEIQIGCSIGVAWAPAHGHSPDQLLEAADQGMYQAKQAGRGAWRTPPAPSPTATPTAAE